MAAPTPVSSLVHSSTLVTAGVYVLIRFRGVLLDYFIIQEILILISFFTTFLAGLYAVVESDFKKIIALSTLRQLGFMVFSISIGYPELAFFHICVHALFKASIFMGVGRLMRVVGGLQDYRLICFFGKSYGILRFILVMNLLALMGAPLFRGYYSKDIIIEMSFFRIIRFFGVLVIILRVVLTLLYRFRLIFRFGFILSEMARMVVDDINIFWLVLSSFILRFVSFFWVGVLRRVVNSCLDEIIIMRGKIMILFILLIVGIISWVLIESGLMTVGIQKDI